MLLINPLFPVTAAISKFLSSDDSDNKIYYRSPLQTEKFHPEGKRILSETRLPGFWHFPLSRVLGFFGLYWRTMVDIVSYL